VVRVVAWCASSRGALPRRAGRDKVGYAAPVEPRPWIASDDFGKIDRFIDEAIVTSFYCLGLPLWPRHSVYVAMRDGAEHRIPIPLQRKSVVLGYLRKPLWFAALVLGSPAIADPARWAWLSVPALVLAAAAAVLTFVAGRLPPDERERRALLRRIVGVGGALRGAVAARDRARRGQRDPDRARRVRSRPRADRPGTRQLRSAHQLMAGSLDLAASPRAVADGRGAPANRRSQVLGEQVRSRAGSSRSAWRTARRVARARAR
jgi:hypothetical protein